MTKIAGSGSISPLIRRHFFLLNVHSSKYEISFSVLNFMLTYLDMDPDSLAYT